MSKKVLIFSPLRTIVRKWVTFYVMMGRQYYYYLSRLHGLIITFFFHFRLAYMIIYKNIALKISSNIYQFEDDDECESLRKKD